MTRKAPSVLAQRCQKVAFTLVLALAAAGAGFLPAASHARGFGASITPPRFEIQVKAGQTQRQVIEIQQSAGQAGSFRAYTNDWEFQPDGNLTFSNAIAADSCRQRVAIERRKLTVAASGRYRFRFEITPPAGTPARECRFAVMVEGVDPTRVVNSGVSIPVGGRIAVIVYASIEGAEPVLQFNTKSVATIKKQQMPTIEVRNTGNAHGRLTGFLNGTDATGQSIELAPADLPILPGESRVIALAVVTDDPKGPAGINYPLAVKGTLEWGKNRFLLEHTFSR